MAEPNDEGIKPVLIDAPQTLDSPSDSAMSLLLSSESVNINLTKLTVLETLLNLATQECRFDDFIREILLLMMRAIKCEAGSIFEVDQVQQSLFFRAVVGRSSDRVMNFVIPLGQGIVGTVAASRKMRVVNNAQGDKLHLKSIENTSAFETRNLIAVPLVIRGQLYGVLELLNRLDQDHFLPEDAELLTYLCTKAAQAIEIRLMLSWTAADQKKKAA